MPDNKLQSTRDKNQDAPSAKGADEADGAGGGNKNLSNARKLRKKLKANSIGADFFTSGAKEAFIHL